MHIAPCTAESSRMSTRQSAACYLGSLGYWKELREGSAELIAGMFFLLKMSFAVQ